MDIFQELAKLDAAIAIAQESVRPRTQGHRAWLEYTMVELSKKFGINWWEVIKNPRCSGFAAELGHLRAARKALQSRIIRANLKQLELNDMVVSQVLRISGHKWESLSHVHLIKDVEVGRVEMPLSNFCSLLHLGLPEPLDNYDYQVYQDGKVIGRFDSDSRFDFESASDLRTALGWAVVTDGGSEHFIDTERFDLDKATANVLEQVRASGTSAEAFHNFFIPSLRCVFVSGHTTRFGSSCGPTNTLWKIATRTVFGEEHSGYTYWS